MSNFALSLFAAALAVWGLICVLAWLFQRYLCSDSREGR